MLSILVVSLETVPTIGPRLDATLVALEYALTAVFTIEYVLRAVSVRQPRRYLLSAMGIIDLVAVLPTYFMILFPGAASFGVVRVFRLLRIFRVFRLRHYVREGNHLFEALKASRYLDLRVLVAVMIIVAIQGALLYVIEGPESGFDSIPRGMYSAVVTLTTVGYGDISPQTALGQAIAAFVMVLRLRIIAVPTGIVTAQLVQSGAATSQAGAVTNTGPVRPLPDLRVQESRRTRAVLQGLRAQLDGTARRPASPRFRSSTRCARSSDRPWRSPGRRSPQDGVSAAESGEKWPRGPPICYRDLYAGRRQSARAREGEAQGVGPPAVAVARPGAQRAVDVPRGARTRRARARGTAGPQQVKAGAPAAARWTRRRGRRRLACVDEGPSSSGSCSP